MKGHPQAKDIDKRELLRAIADIEDTEHRWTFLWDLEARFPAMPPKVVRAAITAAVRNGLASGCTCGCRGDFELTRAGEEFLGAAAAP